LVAASRTQRPLRFAQNLGAAILRAWRARVGEVPLALADSLPRGGQL